MVQVISLDTLTKELTPAKGIKELDSNVDFLDLLLKDIGKNITDESEKDDKKGSILDEKELKDVDDKLMDLKTDIKEFKFNINVDNETKDLKDKKIEEIKNIITSKLKQENIILSKQEEKEFKKIDNLKDLIKFADKKGLNIEKLKVEIPKEEKFDVKTDLKTDSKQEIKNKLEPKTNIILKTNKPIKEETPKVSSSEKKTVSLEDILKKDSKSTISLSQTKQNKKTNDKKNEKLDKEIKIEPKNETKIQTSKIEVEKTTNQQVKTKQTNINQTNISYNKLDSKISNDKHDKKIEIKSSHIQTPKEKTEKIDLESLLNPKKSQPEIKEKKENNDSLINLSQGMVNEVKAKSVQAKQTIESFKNNLDEAIKNYKPPVSKVNIELNPQNLGKVEVTIIKRGNDIQVHMSTDQNNIQLFQTHQAEFRQALSNIGFSNIDMSFNSNQDKERKQNQAKKTYKENEEIEIETGDIEIQANYKYA